MKNLKKVLAMVLAFACTFTMFAGAKVFEDVPAGSDYSEAITMLSDLGIIQGKDDGKYHPEDTITRAEACAMIARLMTGDPNVSQYTGAQNFADVAKGSWKDSAIGYCYINNIVVGVGNNKFEPDRAITDAEFITMVVRAMGYETPDMTQGYPFSYMSNAQAIGLLDGVNMVASTDALRGEDAQVIYNAMFTDYARGAMLVNTTHGTSVESYPTLAESVWGLDRAAVGTWNEKSDEDVTLTNCKAHTWVVIGAAQDEENAILAYPIDDDTTDLYKSDDKNKQYATYKFKYDGDVDSIRGYQVELWGEGSHGEPTWEKGKSDGTFVYSEDWKIKAIKTVKGQTKYDYNPSMADSKADNGTIVLDDETSLDLDSVAGNAKNVQSSDAVPTQDIFLGDSLNTVSIKDDKSVEKALNVRNGAQYQLMDWDSDGDVDWVVVDEAHYYKVEAVSSKRVTVASMDWDSDLKSDKDEKVETWKLDESEKIATNNAGKDVKIKYEVPDGLAEGDIVEVTYKVTNEGKSQIITATVSVVDAENKTLDKVATKDGLTLTFSDEEMKVAQNAELGDVIVPENPQEYKDFNGEELGTEFALWTNRNGFIVYSDYATETANYMMVLNTAGGKNVTGSRDLAQIDIVTADNKEMDDVKVSSSARVLDIDGNTLKNSNGDLAYDQRAFDESQVVGNVFKYWTDEDGVITKMQAVFDSNRKETTDYTYDADADRLVDANGKYVASLEDANVIFAVRKEYIKKDTTTKATVLDAGAVVADGSTTTKDLVVDANDVHATKQADIPDIGTDPTDEELIDNTANSLNGNTSWLGAGAASNNTKYAVQLDKNSEATAAVLGVSNFNKFNSGATKLGLVTNVSEDKNGVIEVMAAYDGKVEAVSSVEKQDFEDIVKVYDDTDKKDVDVTGTDATISAANNGIFNQKKLSEVVNNGGQYAEITTDADGKLTKVVFLDDDNTTNDNKLIGHYYTVSRNLVLKTDNKKLQYALNDNQRYDDVTAAQYFASDSELYSVGRLEADSVSYADDAKFYVVDANPTRHDEDYKATRLTVNAGFDSLDAKDITVGEYSDIAFYEPDYRVDDNIYEISDLAFNSKNELVAAYSFDNMDENSTDISNVVLNSVAEKTLAQGAPETEVANLKTFTNKWFALGNVYLQGDSTKAPVAGLTAKLYDSMGAPLNSSTPVKNASVKVSVGAGVPAGTYCVDVNVQGTIHTYTFKVSAVGGYGVPASVEIATVANNQIGVGVEKAAAQGALSFNVSLTNPMTGLTKSNFKVYDATNNKYLTVDSVEETQGAGLYTITTKETLTGLNVVVSVISGGTEVVDTAIDTANEVASVASVAATVDGSNAKNLNVTTTGSVASLTAANVVVLADGKPVKVTDVTGSSDNFVVETDTDLTGKEVVVYVGGTDAANTATVGDEGGETDPTVQADGVQAINANGDVLVGGAAAGKEVYFQLKNGEKVLDTKIENVQVINSIGMPISDYTVVGNSKGIYMLTKNGGNVEAGTYTIGIGETKVADLEVVDASAELTNTTLTYDLLTQKLYKEDGSAEVSGLKATIKGYTASELVIVETTGNTQVGTIADDGTVTLDAEAIAAVSGMNAAAGSVTLKIAAANNLTTPISTNAYTVKAQYIVALGDATISGTAATAAVTLKMTDAAGGNISDTTAQNAIKAYSVQFGSSMSAAALATATFQDDTMSVDSLNCTSAAATGEVEITFTVGSNVVFTNTTVNLTNTAS